MNLCVKTILKSAQQSIRFIRVPIQTILLSLFFTSFLKMQTPLELQIQTLPDNPGVYQYYDKDGKILYVKKSIYL